jgi:phage gp45-like
MQKQITIRQNNRALQMVVPVEFVRAFGLNAGDSVLWSTDGHTVALKFFRVTKIETPALMEQEAAVEAT